MPIYTSPVNVPQNLLGYSLWLEVLHEGKWERACVLGRAEARQLLRYLATRPSVLTLRVNAESTW